MNYDPIVEPFIKKRVLITGGAGFIGSHLAQKLVAVADQVVCLDNYLSGRSKNHIAGITYIKGSVNEILDIFGSQKFNYIFHFGEYSRVELSIAEPHLALQNTYKSFPSMLQFWQKSGAKIIYSGSSTKFADNGKGRHLSPYTAAKTFNTELLCDFAKWYNLPFCIVYFYNVYGGRELRCGKYSTVIGKFKELVYNGSITLPVTIPGTQRRNFTYIEDVINGILLVAGNGLGDGYGIGADDSYSIIEVCNAFGCEPEFQSASPANRFNSELNTDKTKGLGWIPKYSLQEHITNFLDSIRQK